MDASGSSQSVQQFAGRTSGATSSEPEGRACREVDQAGSSGSSPSRLSRVVRWIRGELCTLLRKTIQATLAHVLGALILAFLAGGVAFSSCKAGLTAGDGTGAKALLVVATEVDAGIEPQESVDLVPDAGPPEATGTSSNSAGDADAERQEHVLGLVVARMADWLRTWAACDVDGHMLHYWPDAQMEPVSLRYIHGVRYEHRRHLDREEFRRHVARTCRIYDEMSIRIGTPRLLSSDRVQVTIRFPQHFQGFRRGRVAYEDFGWKTLMFSVRDDEVRIVFETWHEFEQPTIELTQH